MKIGILTHPQGINYGGILQCYALCAILRKLGHEPIVLQRVSPKSFFLVEWSRTILRYLHFPRYYNPKEANKSVNIKLFVDTHLVRTNELSSNLSIKRAIKKYRFEAVIVGSDQVWRTSFAMNYGYNYFLDFVPDNVIKISYAASFGLNEWQYTPQQTLIIKKLLSRFQSVSVREEEAIDLLEQNVGIKATQHLDPTLLLSSQDYESIIGRRVYDEKYVFVYWLGDKTSITGVIDKYIANGIRVCTLFLRDNVVLPSVEDWLSLVKYAEEIITDSFHGCVFSFLFNKKLKVFSNTSGGYGRILSLFKMLDVTTDESMNSSSSISNLEEYRNDAIRYLLTRLSQHK